MNETKEPQTNKVNSTKTTFEVIEGLQKLNGAGVTELSNYLSTPKSTVHKHLVTLENLRYVYKADGKYHLGYRFINLGHAVEKHSELYQEMKPIVERLAEMTEETAGLCVVENFQCHDIYQVPGKRNLNSESPTKRSHDFHASAAGKATLAAMSDEKIRKYLSHQGMPDRTANTITDEGRLFEEIARIRNRGIAYDREEQWPDTRSVALTVQNDQETELGAIYVVGPVERMSGKRFEEEIPQMMQGAIDNS